MQETQQSETRGTSPLVWLLLAVGIVAAGALGYWLGVGQQPGPDSPEVGFARDMSVHHAQAVEMAMLLYDRTEDEVMRQLAVDIWLTQQNQIGRMESWLTMWDEPLLTMEPKMVWMGMPTDGLMPGMATREELNALTAAEGTQADAIFMQLMIPHHISGVAMAEAIMERSDHPVVDDLAQSMVTAQAKEIELMQELLQAKGYEPVPIPDMEMDMGNSHDMGAMESGN